MEQVTTGRESRAAIDRRQLAFSSCFELEGRVREQNNSVEWIIANTINKTAQGDPDALAARIIAALERAGYEITPTTSDLSNSMK